MNRRQFGVALIGALLATAPLTAKEVSGVTMPDTAKVGEKTLKLNGMGVRKKSIFKVYVGGLYLENATKDAAAVIALDGEKAIRMQFVRSVEKGKLNDAFKEGFEANFKEKAAAQKANIDKFLAMTPDTKDGSLWMISYAPGKGTTMSYDGKDAGTIEGKDFADAVFSLWFGPKPPSEDLKKGMLGM